MTTKQIAFQTCKSDMQAQVFANAAEESGGDVFSIFESGGSWYVWYKETEVDSRDALNKCFREKWEEHEAWDKDRRRRAKLADGQ